MTSNANKLPLETEPVACDNNTILTLKPGDQTLWRLTQLIIVVNSPWFFSLFFCTAARSSESSQTCLLCWSSQACLGCPQAGQRRPVRAKMNIMYASTSFPGLLWNTWQCKITVSTCGFCPGVPVHKRTTIVLSLFRSHWLTAVYYLALCSGSCEPVHEDRTHLCKSLYQFS